MRIQYLLLVAPAISIRAAEETIIKCKETADCIYFNPYFECKPVKGEQGGAVDKADENTEAQVEKHCVHKDLWPLYPKEWIGTICFSMFMLVANIAGIGGGGIAIPMAIYFFELNFKKAIPVSSFSIMLSTVARFFFNFNEKHPEKP